MDYESLEGYCGGQERDLWLWSIDGCTSRLVLFDRHIDEEWVHQYGLTLSLPKPQAIRALGGVDRLPPFCCITPQILEGLSPAIVDARVCTTIHPSGHTMASWLTAIGFREVLPTHSGATFAGRLFEHLPADRRPTEMPAIDAMLRPIVQVVIQMRAPLDDGPMITATK